MEQDPARYAHPWGIACCGGPPALLAQILLQGVVGIVLRNVQDRTIAHCTSHNEPRQHADQNAHPPAALWERARQLHVNQVFPNRGAISEIEGQFRKPNVKFEHQREISKTGCNV